MGEQYQRRREGSASWGGLGTWRGPSVPGKQDHTDLALIIFNQDLAGLYFFDDAPDSNIGFVGKRGIQPHMVTLEVREKTAVRPTLHLLLLAQDLPFLGTVPSN